MPIDALVKRVPSLAHDETGGGGVPPPGGGGEV
jgi:hypothetical protein